MISHRSKPSGPRALGGMPHTGHGPPRSRLARIRNSFYPRTLGLAVAPCERPTRQTSVRTVLSRSTPVREFVLPRQTFVRRCHTLNSCGSASDKSDLNQVLEQRDAKLAEAQTAQADLIRKQRELDDAKREIDLTVQKQVQAGLSAIRQKAKEEVQDAATLKVREKEEQIASMQRQIEELRRKAEQGSQQLQGEVQELELETILRQKFTHDLFEPVPKGEFGGDLIQRVVAPTGQICGSLLWEVKRTKSWSNGWLSKLRDDQRAAKADLALIVSQALPKGLQTFDYIDGVWVTEPRCAVPVAIALRESLVALWSARFAGEGQQTKMELVYRYLTGPRFKHRIEAIVEHFSDMQADLDRERKATIRLWAKREEQIRAIIDSTAGMYGDLQGIAGRSFQEIEGLEMPLLSLTTIEVLE